VLFLEDLLQDGVSHVLIILRNTVMAFALVVSSSECKTLILLQPV
jgi:hypothetical protein